MNKLLLGAVLIITTVAAGASAWGYERFGKVGRAWNDACTISGYVCEGTQRPFVSYDRISGYEGLLGYYKPGTNVIFIAEGQNPDVEYSVLVHEMVHYLQYNEAAKAGMVDQIDSCAAEREAFKVSDLVLKRLGLYAYMRRGNMSGYNCANAS